MTFFLCLTLLAVPAKMPSLAFSSAVVAAVPVVPSSEEWQEEKWSGRLFYTLTLQGYLGCTSLMLQLFIVSFAFLWISAAKQRPCDPVYSYIRSTASNMRSLICNTLFLPAAIFSNASNAGSSSHAFFMHVQSRFAKFLCKCQNRQIYACVVGRFAVSQGFKWNIEKLLCTSKQ